MARESSPAFQFYPKDFLADGKQAAMSPAEAGIYIRLLAICWLEGSIPDDVVRLAHMVGANTRAMRKLWPAVRACFADAGQGALVQPRLERERLKQEAFRQLQRQKGQASAAARQQLTATEPPPNGNRPATEPQPEVNSPSPSPTPYVQATLGTDGVPVDGGELKHSSPPAVLVFPTVGAVTTWALTTDQVASWTAAYPDLDIVRECRHALAWIQAAPARRKTARGMARFLVSWLNRAVDRRGAPLLPGPAPTVGALNADYVRRRRGQP